MPTHALKSVAPETWHRSAHFFEAGSQSQDGTITLDRRLEIRCIGIKLLETRAWYALLETFQQYAWHEVQAILPIAIGDGVAFMAYAVTNHERVTPAERKFLAEAASLLPQRYWERTQSRVIEIELTLFENAEEYLAFPPLDE